MQPLWGVCKNRCSALLNQGALKENIAVSVLQAVVIQTISGLVQVVRNISFLGGPLYFLSELRARFILALEQSNKQVIFPNNSQLYIAMGAALSVSDTLHSFSDFINCTDQTNENRVNLSN